ncbi:MULTISPECIES: efflux RND transporter periplasmic adaptor subunit [Gammaproteobacteria]|uniref:efflux RND transporter periplasmic adaptor subunit n=1 Tax=Gammaproteobacteria TaxID=1236 RepID=UPI000DD0CF86|nr:MULTISPECIES: efflux RND transporter periplasmic adaptor subunit [Gammaproteobacteria]RTE87369.1 efflux RND transporter periplasmic adaptor subunit [Aliidiomarina sp. B3213]TCZ92845.1 efflux RND transporter periplasmic adaptor subunit [Lysobacter sp. N42]
MNIRLRNQLLSVFALVSASTMLAGCGNVGANGPVEEEVAETERGVPVEVVTASIGEVKASFTGSAILEAEKSTDVIPRVNGIVEQILVEEGDYVEEGQILAQLESSRYQLALNQINAELRNVRQELTRHVQLAERQLVSADAVSRLQSQHDSLQAQLELAQKDLDETTVRAPISGHISERYAREGHLIQAWQPQTMFHIVDISQLRATVHLPESALQHLVSGQNAEIAVPALPSLNTMDAHVQRISPIVDSGSGTFRVVLNVPNENQQLRPGLFTRVNIHYAEKTNVVRIPQDALISVDNQSHVFRVEDGVAHKVTVQTGIRDHGWVEIEEGLSDGNMLVITGQSNLRDESKVEVIEP